MTKSETPTSRQGFVRVGVVIAGIVVMAGCGGGATRRVRDASFALSGMEEGIAAHYDKGQPKDGGPREMCLYWTAQEQDSHGGHTIGILRWPASYFDTLRSWAAAKKEEACSKAEEAKAQGEANAARIARETQQRGEEEEREKLAARIQSEKAFLVEDARALR